MRNAICSFAMGAAVTAGAGAFYLRKSLFESSGELQVAIGALAKDVNTTNKDLSTRLAKLEAKVLASSGLETDWRPGLAIARRSPSASFTL